jgi:hypothetical protein
MKLLQLQNGWHRWIYSYPPDVLIEMRRPEWNEHYIGYKTDLQPEMDIGGLYWRMTGIGREQMARCEPSWGTSNINRYIGQYVGPPNDILSSLLGGGSQHES